MHEPRTELRVCVVCRWRRFESDGSAVCRECELRMAAQLDALAAAVPLAGVIASREPTRRGTLDLDAVDLTRPAHKITRDGDLVWSITDDPTDQIGHTSIAAGLAWWVEKWSDREVWSADADSLAEYVKGRLWWACRHCPAVAEFAAEVRRAYAATRRAIGRGAEPVRYGALCPGCHARRLCRPSGADWVECAGCKRQYEESYLPELARASLYWEMDPDERLTSVEAALVHGMSSAVIRQWVHRGELAADIGPWGDQRYYRRSEVDRALAVMEDRERTRVVRRERREARRVQRLRRLELRAA